MRHDQWAPRRPVTLREELEACAAADRWRTERGTQDHFLTLLAHGFDPRPTSWQDKSFALKGQR